MNIYNILRFAGRGSIPAPLKLLGLWALHVCGRRTAGVFIDPVLSCNLRCRMCYFSDPEKRGQLHGVMTAAQIDQAERALFHRALKLQIGCGAEPTLYPHLCELVRRGRQAGVPYISLTTNGQLLATGKVDPYALAEAGLNEITLSMHGTTAAVYEELMTGAKFDNLLVLTKLLGDVKARFPDFKIRVNYTVNSLNIHDLEGEKFWNLWPDGVQPDIVQLRPVQNLGKSAWKDFDLQPIIAAYDSTIGAVAEECRRRGIICIAPSRSDVGSTGGQQDNASAVIEDVTYCYVSPDSCYKADFRDDDTYESYHRRHRTARALLRAALHPGSARDRRVTKKLNYRIK